jgi:hypothetical protein
MLRVKTERMKRVEVARVKVKVGEDGSREN